MMGLWLVGCICRFAVSTFRVFLWLGCLKAFCFEILRLLLVVGCVPLASDLFVCECFVFCCSDFGFVVLCLLWLG